MKKLFKIAFAFVLAFGLCTTTVKAEETYMTVTSYTETFKPVGEDAELTASVVATAGSDGYVYLIKTFADTTVNTVKGENIVEEVEEYTLGAVNYFRAKVVDPTVEATLTVVATCTGFYAENLVADDNGGNTNSVAYTFTNNFSTEIGKYKLTIFTPEGNEIVKVVTPNKYAKFTLGEEEGLLSVGVSGKTAVGAAQTISYTYNTATTGTTKAIVWVVCLGVGALVLFDRLKKAK